MGSIRMSQDSGSGSTEGTDFIKCIDGQQPQIHEFWCLGLDWIIREFCPTERVEVPAGNVGEFGTNYLAEMDAEPIPLGNFPSTTVSNLWVFPNQSSGTGMLFIYNIQAPIEATGWRSANNSNQN